MAIENFQDHFSSLPVYKIFLFLFYLSYVIDMSLNLKNMITNLSIDILFIQDSMETSFNSVSLILFPEIRTYSNEKEPQNDVQETWTYSLFQKSDSLQKLGSNHSIPQKNSAFTIYSTQFDSQQSISLYHENKEEQKIDQQCGKSQEKIKNNKLKKNKKELMRLQTKNLNRFFRSKINEMLRDIKQKNINVMDATKIQQLLTQLNSSNKIMFSQISKVIQDQWLNKKLMKCQASLMKYIHRGKMGMSSKLVMLKYFDKILKAIKNPEKFTCWK